MVQMLRGSSAPVGLYSDSDEQIWTLVVLIISIVSGVIITLSSDSGDRTNEEGRADVGGRAIPAGTDDLGELEGSIDIYRPLPPVPIDATADAPPAPQPAKAKKKPIFESIAHEHIVDKSIVYFHLDVEDGGPRCGIVQLSVVVMDANLSIVGEFDHYVKPRSNAVWSDKAIAVHGLTPEDPRIVGARDTEYVWRLFTQFVEGHLPGDTVGMLVAWNGRGSDMTKLFQITEILYKGVLTMPKGLQFFCDPIVTLKNYTSCELSENRRPSKVPGYGLDVVYREAFGRRIGDDFEGGAHNSLNDARAQAKIFAHKSFAPFIDKNKSVITMDQVWRGKYKNLAEQAEEPTRQVPPGYSDTNLETFEIPREKRYTGPSGGGRLGPTSAVTRACASRKLSDLFLFYIDMEMLGTIARETNRYANGQWVRKVSDEEIHGWKLKDGAESDDTDDEDEGSAKRKRRLRSSVRKPKQKRTQPSTARVEIDLSAMTLQEDHEGAPADGSSDNETSVNSDSTYSLELDAMSMNSDYDDSEEESEDDEEKSLDHSKYVDEPKRRERLVECRSNHPDRRKRWKDKCAWVDVTEGQLMAYFGILCIRAAIGYRTWRIMYQQKNGFHSNFVRNALPRDRFDAIVRFIHFVDNKKLYPKKHPKWHPLQKIQPFTDALLKNIRRGYVMGQNMTVDESMIRYMGRSVSYVQYMPAKPIKHGIKVFALSCSESGYLYGFYVYTGAENDKKSKVQIVEALLGQDSDFLSNSAGRVLYTDNYYTSEALMETLYDRYGIFLVGTWSLSSKKSRTEDDFAFHELSPAAARKVGKGWIRCAQKKKLDARGKTKYIVQNTTWMDRKQVGIVHNYKVGPPGTAKTLRYDKKAKMRMPVSTHEVVPDYVSRMRGVDMSDQGMAGYDITLKSNRYYLSIFYYDGNAAFQNMRVDTKLVVGQAKEQWLHEQQMHSSAVPQLEKEFEDPWLQYVKSSTGNFQWTLDMGYDLIEAGILMDWKDPSDPSQKPKWIRQASFLPCSCHRCFFCKYNLTSSTGPYKPRPKTSHKRSRSTPPTTARHRNKIVELEANHVRAPQKRVLVSENAKDCGVCLEEGRRRKNRLAGEDGPVMKASKTGCPHPSCREHPVCKDHWAAFKHQWRE